MTWYGHVHSYSRTCPVYQRNCMGFHADGSAAAPVHVLIGEVPWKSPFTRKCQYTLFLYLGFHTPGHATNAHLLPHGKRIRSVLRVPGAGHAGAPYSWTINDETPPYYEAVAVRHGYMRATANRTTFHAQARRSPSSAPLAQELDHILNSPRPGECKLQHCGRVRSCTWIPQALGLLDRKPHLGWTDEARGNQLDASRPSSSHRASF